MSNLEYALEINDSDGWHLMSDRRGIWTTTDWDTLMNEYMFQSYFSSHPDEYVRVVCREVKPWKPHLSPILDKPK